MSEDETPANSVPPSQGPQPRAPAAQSALPYTEVTHQDYAVLAARFEAQPTHGGIILRGPCPRCADSMEFPVVDKIFKSIRQRPASTHERSDDPVVPMMCTCLVAHPGAPQALPGCGAYWNLRVGTGAS